MRTSTQNRRRTQPRVESLEGKELLSTGAVMQQLAPHVSAAAIAAQATPAITGTLTGPYSNVHAPGFRTVLGYSANGTLSTVGTTSLHGSLFVRTSYPPGRFVGQLQMRNAGGAMIINVRMTSTLGVYTYNVAFANGTDTSLRGDTGVLIVTNMPSSNFPFVTLGDATMTFA
jgi:hypothetical protein